MTEIEDSFTHVTGNVVNIDLMQPGEPGMTKLIFNISDGPGHESAKLILECPRLHSPEAFEVLANTAIAAHLHGRRISVDYYTALDIPPHDHDGDIEFGEDRIYPHQVRVIRIPADSHREP